jgi:hypothetical protein
MSNTYQKYDPSTGKSAPALKQYQFKELDRCDNIANEAARFLFSLFPEVEKNWQPGQCHLMVFSSKESKHFNIYVTANLHGLMNGNDGKWANICTNDRLVLAKTDDFNFILKRPMHKQTYKISLKKDCFLIDGEKREYSYKKDCSNPYNKDLSYFLRTSLEAQAKLRTAPIGRKKGTQKSNQNHAAQQQRNGRAEKVRIEFDNPHGYKEDVKDSIRDAYAIALVKYGYNQSFMNFCRRLRKGPVEVNSSQFLGKITCSLVVVTTRYNNKYIYIGEEQNSEDSDLNKNSLKIIAGCNNPKPAPQEKMINSTPQELKSAVFDDGKLSPAAMREYSMYVRDCGIAENGESYALSYEEWEKYKSA